MGQLEYVFGEPQLAGERTECAFGYVAALILNSEFHRRLPMAYFEEVISPALERNSIEFFFNEDGAPVGFIVWAKLRSEDLHRLKARPIFPLRPGAWKTGEKIWIIDMLFPFGHFKYARRVMAEKLKIDAAERVSYYRRNRRRWKWGAVRIHSAT